ncbi:MAG: fibronectin type III domain-containing protein, partial [Candidatus Nanopelagicales bacterium]
TSGALTCDVEGLTNGTTYTFTVRARNAVGTSARSAASSATTPRTVPGRPTAVVAVAGNGSAEIRWKAPVSNGGSAITAYTATSSDGVRSCTTGGELTCQITGLANGTDYTFRVTATNIAGTSTNSAASAVVTPVTVPDAPTSVVAVAGNGTATVSYKAAKNGGSVVTGYTVTSSGGGHTCTTHAALTCAVTGLTNGVAYTFTVTATNAVGTGLPSEASTAVSPRSVPGSPTAVVAVAGNGTATVSWAAPADNGGFAVTRYTVARAGTAGLTDCSTDGALTCEVSGLTNGVAYTFAVSATNIVGTGARSTASATVTPRTIPGRPRSVGAVPGNSSSTVSWVAPATNGGSTITGYTVTASDGGRACTTGGALTCTVAGLTNGLAYTFTVSATNEAGIGAPSAASTPVTPRTVPDAPSSVVAVAGDGKATLSWAAPIRDGGSTISGYSARVSPGGQVCATTGALTCEITGLTNGNTYTYLVTATNTAGTSPEAVSASTILETEPGAPIISKGTAGDGQVDLGWTLPAARGSEIADYLVQY